MSDESLEEFDPRIVKKNGNLEVEDEDRLYGNVEELKMLIGDHGGENDVLEDSAYPGDNLNTKEADLLAEFGSDIDMVSEEDNGTEQDALLAEFSDYGEMSEDDEENFMDAIREANNFKRKKKGKSKSETVRGPRRERPLDPEVAQLMSEANEAFVRSDLVVAERLFNEVIKKDARNFPAYEILGDIYQLQGRLNDCCNSWFLAAHLNSSDWEFWKVVARLSADLGHVRQAIYCYSRVININHDDLESIYCRSILYKNIGQIGRALEGFQKLHSKNPFDANILRELAVLYVEYNRINDAIDLYLNIFQDNIKRREAIMLASENALESSDEEGEENIDDEEDSDELEMQLTPELVEQMEMYPGINWKKLNKKHKCIIFDWSSLNILAELFLKLNVRNSSGIKTIKKCARWIQNREIQSFWKNVADDSEFDRRRFKNARFDSLTESEKNKSYTLPIDIRIRLGLLRLNNNQLLEALNHFQFLYDENFDEIADLYFEVGTTLVKTENYKEAIDFFTPLLSMKDYCNIDLFRPLGKCYKEVENYEKAFEFYMKVVEEDSTDLDDKLTLAEINYYLGRNEEFNKLLVQVIDMRQQQADELLKIANEVPESSTASDNSKDVSSKPLLEDSMFRQSNFKKKKTPQDVERERAERERKITLKVLDKYKKLQLYKVGVESGDKNKTTLWVNTVSDLIDIFSSVKNFFVKSRSKKFVGIIRRTRKFNKAIDFKIERLSKLSEGDNGTESMPLMEERVILTSTSELRGLTYDQWFELFMELSLTITKYQSIEDGLSVIETAEEVNVFFQDPERVKMMRFVKLAIILQMGDKEELIENLRGLLNQFQFNRKVLQVFMFSLSHNQMSLNILSSTVQQKFFLRQLKAFDSCRYNTHVSGQASITNKAVINPDKKSSPYLYYIYAVLLYSSRGFLSALQYLQWLERDLPEDPMVNLLSGLSHLHRSMQRLTATRHFQLLHGLRYLFKYYDIRMNSYTEVEKQEADYNAGRAFHLLGLVSIAVRYYNKVLEDYEDSSLKKHAAYNSIIIYQESGNTELASHLMEKYLTV